jgi:hypothetical protein
MALKWEAVIEGWEDTGSEYTVYRAEDYTIRPTHVHERTPGCYLYVGQHPSESCVGFYSSGGAAEAAAEEIELWRRAQQLAGEDHDAETEAMCLAVAEAEANGWLVIEWVGREWVATVTEEGRGPLTPTPYYWHTLSDWIVKDEG